MSVRDQIRSFIRESFFVDGFEDGDSLLANGLVDSMGMAELIAFLETEFDLAIDDGELVPENLDSVERAASFVERKRRRSA